MSIQNSIELVKKAIEFKKPERVPLDFLPPRYSDFCWVTGGSMLNLAEKRTSIYYTDEWGCTWKRIDKSMGRPFKYPLKNWEDIKGLKFPNPLGPEKREVAKQTIAENPGKFIIGADPCMGMWERAKALIGTEEFLVGLYTQTEYVCELLDRLVNFQVKTINKWNELGVHGFITADDWGTQETLWIKPQIWRRIFKPRYKKIAKVLHSYNLLILKRTSEVWKVGFGPWNSHKLGW